MSTREKQTRVSRHPSEQWRLIFVAIVLLVFLYMAKDMYLGNANGDPRHILKDGSPRKPLSTLGTKCVSGAQNFSEYRQFSKSQQGEDAFLWKYFGDLCDGSYIELGALDGVKYSNSHVFSKALGWSGILIEASPINAAKLIRNRPNDICVNAAVCQTIGVVHYVEGGAVGGIWEFMAESFRTHWHRGKTILDASVVPCAPLSEIVRNHTKQEYFDFLSLDVEGGELSVIQTMMSLEFGMIIVEADKHDIRKNSMVHTFLSRRNYVQIEQDLGNNQIYLHPKFDEIYGKIIQSIE